MSPRIRPVLISLSALAFAVACSSSDPEETFVGAKGAHLYQAEGCEDLLAQIQQDAVAKLDQQVELFEQQVDDGEFYGGDRYYDDDMMVGVAEGATAPAADGGDVATGTGGTSANSDAGGESSSPESHSETNTQVEGVDEADIVKTDGERIYLLHGNQFYIMDAWPADESRELGRTQVEGSGFELFVADGKATVFSTVYPEVGDSSGDDIKLDEYGYDAYYYGGGDQFTKISVYDVTGNSPALEREMIFEGNYVSARRHGEVVRTIVQGGFQAPGLYYPDVDTYDTFGNEKSNEELKSDLQKWRDEVAEDIQASELDDWIPRRYEREGGAWEALPAQCDSYFIPAPGLVEDGVTQVVTFDTSEDIEPQVTAVLGGAQHVYANHDVVLLAQADWNWEWGSVDETRTVLHQFRIDGAASHYEASGFVPGYIHNQFSIDERAGVVRLSTTQETRSENAEGWWDTDTVNYVVTLGNAEGELEVLGRTKPLAQGETIFSTRFIGDRGYVVTFRQVDPLFVIDLSDAANPTVMGELKIPGFSDYMHPLEGNYLLTIGQDADENGSIDGAALQIFDVSDPNDPKLAHKETYGGFSYSEASNNHKAFTFVDDYFGDDQGLLMFPLVSYEPDYVSSLEVVQVSAQDGFTSLSSIDHTGLINAGCSNYELTFEPCYYYYGEEMRRGVQIDDYVYAVSQGGITVHPMDALDSEVARIELPQPEYNDYYYGGVGGSVGVEPEPAIDVGMGGSGAAGSL